MKRTLVLATRNLGKVRELKEILGSQYRVEGLDEFPDAPDWEEQGETFQENALEKAVLTCRATGLVAMADDSGLEVDALGGAPGVRSARYAGPEADDAANVRKLLEALRGVSDRTARFRCVIAVARPDGKTWIREGLLEGHITAEPRGDEGFGYDPVFVPQGDGRTLAEFTLPEKNLLSHRARAVVALREVLAGEVFEP